jgi:class 3 adenylate cyclase
MELSPSRFLVELRLDAEIVDLYSYCRLASDLTEKLLFRGGRTRYKVNTVNTEIAIKQRAKIEEFRRKHHTGLVTLLFTDIVDSTKLKRTLGDRDGVALIQEHHDLVRDMERLF